MTLATTAPILDTEVFTPFDRVTSDIEIAEKEAIADFGDYKNPDVNKRARSYVAKLRKVRASVDKTRKAQNEAAQTYIQDVNTFSKKLEARVTSLITPHETILKSIKDEEDARIAEHENNIQVIIDMGKAPVGVGSAQIQEYLDILKGIDHKTFEEFTPKADAELVIATAALEQTLQAALDTEEAAARREQERKDAAEAARVKREQDIADKAAAEAKEKAEAEAATALDAERKKTEAAEQRAARAEEEKEVVVAEAAAAKVEVVPQVRLVVNRGCAPWARTPEPVAAPPSAPTKAQRRKLSEFIQEMVLDHSAKDFAQLLVNGELHPAISIDWSEVC
jgi:phage-related minor tail protein